MLNCHNSPSPALGLLGLGGLLILSHLEQLVGQAFRVGAVGLPELGNVHHTARLKLYQNDNPCPSIILKQLENCEQQNYKHFC